MKQIFKKYWWLLVAILIIAFSFYWFEWRPSEIRKECSKYQDILESVLQKKTYEKCLREHGLEK